MSSKSAEIRQAISADIPELMEMDHGYSTDHVWQMGVRDEHEGKSIQFQEVRLPRPMRVSYPRDPKRLADEWTHRSVVLIAESDEHKLGYTSLVPGPAPDSVWLIDLVVDLRFRGHGHGKALMLAAREWAVLNGFGTMFVEVQTKNFPAIQLARRTGFTFSGYSDAYFPDGDIALFFSQKF